MDSVFIISPGIIQGAPKVMCFEPVISRFLHELVIKCQNDSENLWLPVRRQVKKGEGNMPKIQVNEITMNYDQQGTGEPLVLIPYLAADYACYAFQVAEYAKHFTCISVDLRGAGETD